MATSNKVVLVTGGCGFVGSHLVKSFLEEERDVWILDNLFTGKHPDNWLTGFQKEEKGSFMVYSKDSARIIFINQDAIDFFSNQINGNSLIRLPYFDEIYHLAAIVGGRAVLIENNPILVATNQVIDSLFFQWAVKNRESIGRVLYVSTSVAYPKTMQDKGKYVAMEESFLDLRHGESVGLPESIYGWIKLAGEYLAVTTATKYGLSVVCVRPFSGYGGDQDLSYPIPSIALRAVRRENPLSVWGSGNQGRDFIYVDDFVAGLRTAIQNVSDGSAVNIGMGELVTFKEVARIMAELVGYTPKIIGLTDKVEGAFAVYADNSRLKNFGWIPKYSIRDGFKVVLDKVKTEIAQS